MGYYHSKLCLSICFALLITYLAGPWEWTSNGTNKYDNNNLRVRAHAVAAAHKDDVDADVDAAALEARVAAAQDARDARLRSAGVGARVCVGAGGGASLCAPGNRPRPPGTGYRARDVAYLHQDLGDNGLL